MSDSTQFRQIPNLFRLAVLLGAVLLVSPLPCDGEGYHWPLSAPPALNSTFGEHRPSRFHAGVDLKTWGKEGYAVHAVGDGYIWRIRTSPWGMGKAIYLKLEDGRTAVYSHLSSFMDPVREVVEAEQDRRGNYSVNLFFKEGQIPVRRGQTIGLSGRTATIGPHLHFELRDGEQRPMNPLRHGFRVEDTIAPTILSLAAIPLDPHARVEGGYDPVTVPVRWNPKAGRYESGRVLSVEGRVGIAVDVLDRADASQLSNRLAPSGLRLDVDGTEVFRTEYTIFSFEQVGLVELDRNFRLRRKGAGVYHNLYREIGNDLLFYRGSDGILSAGIPDSQNSLNEGKHSLEVSAVDLGGNRARAILEIHVTALVRVASARAKRSGDSIAVQAEIEGPGGREVEVWLDGSSDDGQTWKRLGEKKTEVGTTVAFESGRRNGPVYRVGIGGSDGLVEFQTCSLPTIGGEAVAPVEIQCESSIFPTYVVLRIESDRLLVSPPIVRIVGAEPGRHLPVMQRDLRHYETVLTLKAGSRIQTQVMVEAVGVDGGIGGESVTLDLRRISMAGGRIRSSDGIAEAVFEEESIYWPLYGRIESAREIRSNGLPMVGSAYRFLPDDVPFRKKSTVRIAYPDGFERAEKLAIFEFKSDSTWQFADNRVSGEGGAVEADVPHFSTYALLLDELPPELTDLVPGSGEIVSDLRPVFLATVRDSGAGIWREEDISMVLNGTALIPEYDPPINRISARPRRELRPGEYELLVRVRDVCGNESIATSRFKVVSAP